MSKDKPNQAWAPDEPASCWCCQRKDVIDWGEVVLAKTIDDIAEGRVTPGEIHWVARWSTPGMRYADIERVAVALEEVGLVRYLGGGRIKILEAPKGKAERSGFPCCLTPSESH